MFRLTKQYKQYKLLDASGNPVTQSVVGVTDASGNPVTGTVKFIN